ncbi:MAG: DNA primase [Verrucomicrobia bacterium]|nr:DNA primase [Verrucomicrobiota bacterium]
MPRIPEEILQQILAATDIVDLVGRSVKLKRSGSGYSGLCPFHQEKTPSFSVSPSRNSYHCFGCGAGGNAFRFVMEHENLSFMEAVKRLGDAAGIRIEETVWDENAEQAAKERAALIRVHADISAWYHTLLMKHNAAEPARAYLKSRGINSAIAANWQMGYAPPHGDPLREWALEKKYSEKILIAAGILAQGGEDSARAGETYPRFRHRLMFPIRNDYGEVIAFSGRLLDSEAKAAKYLNSPETPIFSKSKVFFGLDKSKRAISKAHLAIVCEGQLDLITAFEHGFENIVAPLGTAFTEFHARKLKQLADEIVLCFDSDAAGFKAAERAFTILAPTGLVVKIAPLPQGEDPDSLIRGKGADAFKHQLDAARDFFDHLLDHASTTRDLNETREKTRFAADTAAMIRLLDNPIARDAAIQKVAMRLGIPEADYRRQVSRIAKTMPGKTDGAQNAPPQPLPPQDKTAAMLVRLALADAEILHWLRHSGRENILHDISGAELLALVWKSSTSFVDSNSLAAFLSTLPRDEEHAFSQLLSQPMPVGGMAAAQHALEALEAKRLDNLLQRAQTQLKEPNLSATQIAQLQQRVITLRKEYLDRIAQFKDIPHPSAT